MGWRVSAGMKGKDKRYREERKLLETKYSKQNTSINFLRLSDSNVHYVFNHWILMVKNPREALRADSHTAGGPLRQGLLQLFSLTAVPRKFKINHKSTMVKSWKMNENDH